MPHRRSRAYARSKTSLKVPKGVYSPQRQLYHLPTELWLMIFDFFSPVSIDLSERRENWHVLFRFRATCRRFRSLVNELPFWFVDNVNLMEMIPLYPPHYLSNWADTVKFLVILFQDKHLVQCLERRTSWNFKDVPSLQLVLDCIPSFKTRTRSLNLCCSKKEQRNRFENAKVQVLEHGSYDVAGGCHACPPLFKQFWGPNVYEECNR